MKKPVIVISGPPGAGSTSIARDLSKRLGLRFFSPGFLQKGIAKNSENETKAVIEVWKTKECRSEEFHKKLDSKQIELAKKGGVVICGKLSIHFLPQADLKVWLDVPLKVRAERTAGRDKIPFQKALKAISSRENIERREWKKMYGFDYFEQKNEADLVIDTSDMTKDETIEKIINFLKKR